MIATGLLGALWAVVYLRRRSSVAPIVSHAGFNSLEVRPRVAVTGSSTDEHHVGSTAKILQPLRDGPLDALSGGALTRVGGAFLERERLAVPVNSSRCSSKYCAPRLRRLAAIPNRCWM